ncbi:unnamed protein product [Leuciscus chuanchicus]
MLQDEIALSDAEDSGSESDDSNTDLTASEFGTVEPMAIDSTTTEQDHDMGDFGSVSFVSSRVSESVPPSEGCPTSELLEAGLVRSDGTGSDTLHLGFQL